MRFWTRRRDPFRTSNASTHGRSEAISAAREPAVDLGGDVVDHGEDLLLAQVRQERRDVVTAPVDFGELLGRDVEHAQVDVDLVPGKVRGHLAADHDVREVGQPHRPLDRIVVRDRHEVHPARLRQTVDPLRRVVRLPDDVRQRPDVRHARVVRVDVGVELHVSSRVYSSVAPAVYGRTPNTTRPLCGARMTVPKYAAEHLGKNPTCAYPTCKWSRSTGARDTAG